jgi:AcrR family transcriptional regulator
MPRRRLAATDARRRILAVAEGLFERGGIDSVRVQTIGRALGVTDAAVHYHFGNREALLEALLKRVGGKLKEEIAVIVQTAAEPHGMDRLGRVFLRWYGARGYARLAMWLTLSGWSDRGSGLLTDLVEALHRARVVHARRARRPSPDLEHTKLVVGWFHSSLLADALFGGAVLRSVGAKDVASTRTRFRRLVSCTVERLLKDG